MGHLINPISLRLSVNRMSENLFISNNHYEYHYLEMHSRNLKLFFKRIFEFSVFSKNGYLFSHVSLLGFSSHYEIKVYLYKTFANFRFHIQSLQRLSRHIVKEFYQTILACIVLKLSRFFSQYFFFFQKMLLNTSIFKKNKEDMKLIFFLCLLSKRNRFKLLYNIVQSFIITRFFFLEKCTSSGTVSFKKKKITNIFVLKLFLWFLKFNFWKSIIYFLSFFLRRQFQQKLILQICKINFIGVNLNVIGSYIVSRLKQRFKISEIIMPIMRNLKKNAGVLGFKFEFSGRFSREEIATCEVFSFGAVPLNTQKIFIDYNFFGAILKDGFCGIKIWLNKKNEKLLGLPYFSQNVMWKYVI